MLITNIIFYEGKAYIPITGQTNSGLYQIIAPVYAVEPDVASLTKVLKSVMREGNPIIPKSEQTESKEYQQQVLDAIGVRSWNTLHRKAYFYAIEWGEKQIVIYAPPDESKGKSAKERMTQWKVIELDASSEVDLVVEAILQDLTKHE